ncbi:hypothetical protein phiV208_74 [Vibrio phage phiV208]|nr:hypothetical protein phiV208_74 [Vibrio phage phiV208]
MIKGVNKVKAGFERIRATVSEERTEAAIYVILSEGAANAALMTPVDTSTLVNSQYAPQIEKSPDGMIGYVGYTSIYAPFVHSAPGKLKGLPRANGNGLYWSPEGEPMFLTKGFQQIQPKIPAILKRVYSV